jgi:hypothetical protein
VALDRCQRCRLVEEYEDRFQIRLDFVASLTHACLGAHKLREGWCTAGHFECGQFFGRLRLLAAVDDTWSLHGDEVLASLKMIRAHSTLAIGHHFAILGGAEEGLYTAERPTSCLRYVDR